MSNLELSGSVGVAAIRNSIGSMSEPSSDGAIGVSFAQGTFMETGALAQLTSWLLAEKETGNAISMTGDDNVIRYLARMDVHRSLGLSAPTMTRRPEGGRFIPLILVRDGNDVFEAVNSIADMVMQQFEGVGEFLPAFEWAVNEIIDNVFIHAASKAPGVVCAQLFPNKRRLEIAICDSGVGIRGSLSERFELTDHAAAIEKALERGVTRNVDIGQGNGMAGSLEIMRKNGGKLLVWSGNALYRMENGEELGIETGPEIAGTGVLLSFDLSHPVQLIDTWIGETGWSYIDAEAERVSEQGIVIAEVCSHTGSRPPATRLRRKITSLLPEIEGAVTLDFTGVKTLTSSFLDELLGRLNAKLGNEAFNEKVIVEGLSELHRNMANNVIGQRLALDNQEESQADGHAAWILIATQEEFDASTFNVTLHGAPELFMALREGHWCLEATPDGTIVGIARVMRCRPFTNETHVYFDKRVPLDGSQNLEAYELTGGDAFKLIRID